MVPSKTDWHNAKEPQTKALPAGNDVGLSSALTWIHGMACHTDQTSKTKSNGKVY
jgi:hypothetical protein